jgi:hypothetical protein
MTLLLLYLLASIDGALCGIRVAGGRSPLIRKRSFYLRWLLRGCFAAQIASLAALALLAVAVQFRDNRAQFKSDLQSSAGRMLWIFMPYAAVVLGTLAVRLIPSTDIRSGTSVMVLGPLTAARPLVVVAGVVCGIAGSRFAETQLLGVLVMALMLSLEAALNEFARRSQEREISAIVGH